jgi:uridine kinase
VSAPTARPRARVVLLAGASGSGKTRLARRLGLPTMALDDFYRDGDDPLVLAPRASSVDWDDPLTWDGEAAAAALDELCRVGQVDVPRYDIPSNRRVGTDRMALHGAGVVVAEGIFAAELVAPLSRRLLLADALCLRRNRTATFARRLARDLVEGRKSPTTLVRRGVRLARDEPASVRHWVALGCRPVTKEDAERRLADLAALPHVPPACLNPRVDLLTRLRDGTTDVARRLEVADLGAEVPGCPGWRVADLAAHLGGVHIWARTAVAEGRPTGVGDPPSLDRDDLVAWYRHSADDLVKVLAGADAADSAWTFGEPRTVAFWIRRQAHETAVHAHDLWAAEGDHYVVPTAAAADCVDEVVHVLWPRQVRKEREVPPDAAVELRAADTTDRWVLGDPTRTGLPVVGSVTGPAETLALLLWGRCTIGDPRLTIDGDLARVRGVLDRALTP